VETKVQAGGLAAAVAGAVLWALQTYVFKGSAVPDGVVSLVYAIVPALCAVAAGYLAPHTPRTPPAPSHQPKNVTITPPAA